MTVHLEAILTQLVFEHSLRIRLNASPLDEKDEGIGKTTSQETTTPESTVIPLSESASEAEMGERSEETPQLIEIVDIESENDTVNDSDKSHQNNNKKDSTDASVDATHSSAKDKQPEKSLVGTMTNLVTTDLDIIKIPAGHILLFR